MFFLGIHAKAQLRFGIEYGLNFPNTSFDKIDEIVRTNNLIGFHVGPTLEIKSPLVGINLMTSLLYSQHGFEIEKEDEQACEVKMLEIPVGLKSSILPLSSAMENGIFLLSGVYIGLKLENDIRNQIKTKSFNYGLNIGIGMEIFNHLQLRNSYRCDFTKIDLEEQFSQIFQQKFNPQVLRTWTISLTYFF